jgi:hypothetical protein
MAIFVYGLQHISSSVFHLHNRIVSTSSHSQLVRSQHRVARLPLLGAYMSDEISPSLVPLFPSNESGPATMHSHGFPAPSGLIPRPFSSTLYSPASLSLPPRSIDTLGSMFQCTYLPYLCLEALSARRTTCHRGSGTSWTNTSCPQQTSALMMRCTTWSCLGSRSKSLPRSLVDSWQRQI